MKEYLEAKLEFKDFLENNKGNPIATKSYLLTLINIVYKWKKDIIFDWIDAFFDENPDEKLVVFAYHLNAVHDIFDRYKEKAVYLDGSLSAKKKFEAQSKFQEDKQCKLFVGEILAGGVGIDLFQASTMLFVELWWVGADLEQCEDRINRIGQKNACSNYYLYAKDTVEEDIMRSVIKGEKIVANLLGGSSEDFFKSLT
jgi:SNF2 family DNA or RNA helicase